MTDRRWKFTPQPDITAYELAEIIRRTAGGVSGVEKIIIDSPAAPIPENLVRHFSSAEPGPVRTRGPVGFFSS